MTQQKKGRLFGIGVGPGDPELLTVKAARILSRVPVVCVPKGKAQGSSLALAVIQELIDPGQQQILECHFPMVRDPEEAEEFWQEAARQVLEPLQRGCDVAFVTLGDPLFYSTFIYLYRTIQELDPEIHQEIVPGVSSLHAASAVASLPLGVAGERIAILPATGDRAALRRTLEEFDTIVLLKVSQALDEVVALLETLGLKEKAVFVQKCGMAGERVIRELDRLGGEKVDYFSLLIVSKGMGQRAEGRSDGRDEA
ncbi:MAG: precorrin-2 C(20)-methyltransferase [Candidatus Tectomicrobia bacterium]|uniref:Precorrin-2 C(20)-methyltransferase n=1 Tax=Tectimicrobiota bacterium TaxID=2528274 RepID=A0A932FVI4_UNCTE|nr:precorrin-2 C(20)-methyltransferase [Candidatus Tectomicrobia bacterium]